MKEVANKLTESGQYDFCSLTGLEIHNMVKRSPSETPSGYPMKLNKFYKKTFGGVCGLVGNGSSRAVFEGIPLYAEQDMFFFGYMNKTVNSPRFISLSCSTYGTLDDANYVTKAHSSDSVGICQSYFESLKIYDN
jgi:hypothetical protein